MRIKKNTVIIEKSWFRFPLFVFERPVYGVFLMRCCCRSYLGLCFVHWFEAVHCLCSKHKQNGRSIFSSSGMHRLSSWAHSIWDEMNNDVDDDLFVGLSLARSLILSLCLSVSLCLYRNFIWLLPGSVYFIRFIFFILCATYMIM